MTHSGIKRVQEAIHAIKQGKMIIIMDDKSRENEGDLVMAAELAKTEDINFMIKKARGLVCVPMNKEQASKLNLMPMVTSNEDPYKTAFTVTVDHKSLHTGISAKERTITINELASDVACEHDFNRPGHIFPLIAKGGGVIERRGHTEAAVDIVKLAGCKSVAVICEILKEDGDMAREPELIEFAKTHNLIMITIQELVDYRNFVLTSESNAKLPTKFGNFRIYSFQNKKGGEPHLALVKEDSDLNQTATIRIHSECLTGDVFNSIKCDCKAQLDFGLKTIADSAYGILIYLRQEGRGIGLVEKLKAYALQDQGLDTIDANTRLGHEIDARTYEEAVSILKYFNVHRVNIITNNPDKVNALIAGEISIENQISTPRFETTENSHYLDVKTKTLGHRFI